MEYADLVTHTLKVPAFVHLASGDEVGVGVTWLSIRGESTRRSGCLRLRTTKCYCVPQATTFHLHLTRIVGGLPKPEVARTSSTGRAARINSSSKMTESFRDLLQHSYYHHGDNVTDLNPCYTSVVPESYLFIRSQLTAGHSTLYHLA